MLPRNVLVPSPLTPVCHIAEMLELIQRDPTKAAICRVDGICASSVLDSTDRDCGSSFFLEAFHIHLRADEVEAHRMPAAGRVQRAPTRRLSTKNEMIMVSAAGESLRLDATTMTAALQGA